MKVNFLGLSVWSFHPLFSVHRGFVVICYLTLDFVVLTHRLQTVAVSRPTNDRRMQIVDIFGYNTLMGCKYSGIFDYRDIFNATGSNLILQIATLFYDNSMHSLAFA